ncbi:DUF3093 domain-containing protein [Microbacterium xanthum]|uniref:DUF3093 domain-containing protein n=1 Tax=Microbacterium xanthum TaxID=3079794 RepID=UPI002AD47328|nr:MULTISPECIES: DUF3093 domain-containing protein [unclassified Microbacterium]MDZ8172790.1 DUF3093 domain-containing protein [Microbacterium sp. KSW-48]MDZ8202372.1 DUF3093 domain-containing protein [Microbacterium sp. SSW1-59]
MQNTPADVGAGGASVYRERLSPSLWALVAGGLAGPMAALVLAPIDTTAALALGGMVGIGVIAAWIAASPRIEVTGTCVRVGRAHIDARHLGEPVTLTGEDARHARGPGLHPRAWHLLRGGIDGIVVIPIEDPDDPVPAWYVSSRTPDRLAAAVRRGIQASHSRQLR